MTTHPEWPAILVLVAGAQFSVRSILTLFVAYMDGHRVENYMELDVEFAGRRFSLTVNRAEGRSPATLRTEAEERFRALRSKILELTVHA